jgi:hypothetical protein
MAALIVDTAKMRRKPRFPKPLSETKISHRARRRAVCGKVLWAAPLEAHPPPLKDIQKTIYSNALRSVRASLFLLSTAARTIHLAAATLTADFANCDSF